MPAFERALVIRGGALGDFLLTLPVLAALREAEPRSRIEVLAYPGLAELATSGPADASRSIEYGPLAAFFTRGAALDPALRDYFSSFDLVLSYLYDPDGIFAENLKAAGVHRLVRGPHRPGASAHAIDQLAAPLAEIGVPLAQRAVRLDVVPSPSPSTVAIHPGSGSPSKTWPAARWREVAENLMAAHADLRVAVIGGEADAGQVSELRQLPPERTEFWVNLPLRELAAKLAGARLYLGHDTGVSHLAAASGTPSLLLFGPTEPGVWSPPHDQVRVLRAPGGDMAAIGAPAVIVAAERLWLASGNA